MAASRTVRGLGRNSGQQVIVQSVGRFELPAHFLPYQIIECLVGLDVMIGLGAE